VALDHLRSADLDGRRWPAAGCSIAREQVATASYRPAADVADRLARFCPPGDSAWVALITQALSTGDAQDAADVAERWTEFEPANATGHYYSGLALALLDPAKALNPLKTAQAISPSRLPMAADLIQTIEASLPSDDHAYQLAQVGQTLARAGRWDLAALAFSQALSLEPNYVEAEAYLGLALDHTGGDGEGQLIRASQAVPSASLPHVFLAQHWSLKGDYAQAAVELRTARALSPDSPAIAAQLGAVLVSLGDIQSALAAYQQAVSLAPNSAQFQGLLAAFSLDHEVDVEGVGLPAARQAVVLDRRTATYLDQLGFSYYLKGNPEMAEHMLGLALHAAPMDPAVNYHLGLARLAVNKPDLAVLSLRQAADLDPGGMYAMLATRTLSRLQP
jgi:tetratricopeptide (TPR) repeat protein